MKIYVSPQTDSFNPEREIYGICGKCGKGVYSVRVGPSSWSLDGVLVGVEIGDGWQEIKSGRPYHISCHEIGG